MFKGICLGLAGIIGSLVLEINKPSFAQSLPNLCPANLSTEINKIISRPAFQKARWGILVTPLSSSQPLYRYDDQKYFIPASNAKLFVTAAGLSKLGGNYRIRTSIYRQGTGNTLSLRLVGRGDPSFSKTQLQSLAQQLKSLNISRIQTLIVDDAYFLEPAINSTWQWDDIQAGYGAPINSLILDQNAIGFTLFPQNLGQPLRVVWDNPTEGKTWKIINNSRTVNTTESEFIEVGREFQTNTLRLGGQLRVGSATETSAVAVINPAQRFLEQFTQILTAQNILVNQSSINQDRGFNAIPLIHELAFVESPPLAELLIETNQWSNNLYAEALWRTLGEGKTQAYPILQQTLTQLGVNSSGYQLTDAAGLSRQNLVTPIALVQVLQGIARTPQASIFRQSLAVSGKSGTLRNRLPNLAGKVQAKTGFLFGVAALSGYIETQNRETLVFSILVNQHDQSSAIARQAIDEIVLLLWRSQRC